MNSKGCEVGSETKLFRKRNFRCVSGRKRFAAKSIDGVELVRETSMRVGLCAFGEPAAAERSRRPSPFARAEIAAQKRPASHRRLRRGSARSRVRRGNFSSSQTLENNQN